MSINPGTAPGYIPASQTPPRQTSYSQYTPPPTPAPAPAPYVAPPEHSSNGKMLILFGAVGALLAANVYLFMQMNNLKTEFAKTQNSMLAQLDQLRETNAVTNQTNRRTVEALSGQLEQARRQARMAAGDAKVEALKKVEETKQELEAAQQAAAAQVKTQISEVRQVADTANTKIADVNNEVGAVKTDVATTKTTLDKTISDLKKVSGDVDGHSTLIATNATQLDALRKLGERTYVEFNLHKSKQSQRVGDVSLALKKADPKHLRYTLELTADDKTVEKKDRTINEPLQFMTSKAKQPYEIVVNSVTKDQISGYLSIPKVLNGR